MITANSRRGLLGMGDMGLVVRAGQMGSTEDTLILGIGRKMQRSSVLLGGGVDTAVARTFATTLPRLTTSIAPARDTMTLLPRTTQPVSPTIQPRQPTYTAPSYSPLPAAPAPISDTRVPEPGYDTAAPRPVSPSGATATWTQTTVSPIPTPPPVYRPMIPAAPYVQPSPVDYQADAGVSASNPGDWSYYGQDPYQGRAVAQPAGMQAQDVGTSMVYQDPSPPPTAIVKTNSDGTQVQQDGKVVDPNTNAVVATDWLQWAKDNKTTLGVGAAVLIGAIVLLKVIK